MKLKLMVLFVAVLMVAGLNSTLARRSLTAPPAPSFVGKTWTTTWTTTDGRVVSAPVTIKADGGNSNDLDGTVEANGPNGVMYGTLSPQGRTVKWSGNWWNTDGIHGTFTFTLTDNNNFTGSYTVAGTNGDFDWHGNR